MAGQGFIGVSFPNVVGRHSSMSSLEDMIVVASSLLNRIKTVTRATKLDLHAYSVLWQL